MKDIEEKTGLIRRFTQTREALERLRGELEELSSLSEASQSASEKTPTIWLLAPRENFSSDISAPSLKSRI